jgi:hypothetical protein
MAMSKAPGNQGISSNKLARPGIQTGAAAKGVKPGYTAQLGSMKGTHLTDGRDMPASKALIAKDGKTPAGGNQRLGNECTEPCGPKGEGRTLYGKSGTNQQNGAADRGIARAQGTADRGPRAILGPKGS